MREDGAIVDTLDGPVAVIRNLLAVWPTVDRQKRRCVVVDRFYTSLALAMRLHRMGYHFVGTCRTDRKGFPNKLKMREKDPPAWMQRGDTAIMEHKEVCSSRNRSCIFPHSYVYIAQIPKLYATRWADNKLVYFLSVGLGVQQTTCFRKLKSGDKSTIPCPFVVTHYNKNMSGVDTHDQYRLQFYAMQEAVKQMKYYKTLFLGLIDMALVNAFIIHKCHAQGNGDQPKTHADWLASLQAELLNLRPADFGMGSVNEEGSVKLAHFVGMCDSANRISLI